MAKVELISLRKAFGRSVAVDDIDLTIASGELITLLGPSGCGKTTTLRMLAGLEQPSSGEIRIGDRLIFGPGRNVPPEKREIGMVFQSYAVWPHMTVAQNVGYPLRVRGVPRAEIDRRITEALSIVRLGPYAERYPSQLSGGQQQRVALARALIFNPSILLLDEPLSNLDAQLRETLRTEIRALQQSIGITALFVTHDQEEAFGLSDRIGVMREGRLIQLGSPDAIFETPADRFVAEFVGWKNLVPAIVGNRGEAILGVTAIPVPVPEGSLQGQDVVLGIRPEDIALVDAGDAGPALYGTVRMSAYMGGHSSIEVDIAGQTVVVHDAARRRFAKGEQVRLRFDPSRTLAFAG